MPPGVGINTDASCMKFETYNINIHVLLLVPNFWIQNYC